MRKTFIFLVLTLSVSAQAELWNKTFSLKCLKDCLFVIPKGMYGEESNASFDAEIWLREDQKMVSIYFDHSEEPKSGVAFTFRLDEQGNLRALQNELKVGRLDKNGDFSFDDTLSKCRFVVAPTESTLTCGTWRFGGDTDISGIMQVTAPRVKNPFF